MNKHLNDGQLRAALDGELNLEELEHFGELRLLPNAAKYDPTTNAANRQQISLSIYCDKRTGSFPRRSLEPFQSTKNWSKGDPNV